MATEKKTTRKPPEVSPYLFPLLLVLFGSWCFYDGWLTTDPEMMEHALFNKVVSGIMLPWGVWDYFKTRKYERREKEKKDRNTPE